MKGKHLRLQIALLFALMFAKLVFYASFVNDIASIGCNLESIEKDVSKETILDLA